MVSKEEIMNLTNGQPGPDLRERYESLQVLKVGCDMSDVAQRFLETPESVLERFRALARCYRPPSPTALIVLCILIEKIADCLGEEEALTFREECVHQLYLQQVPGGVSDSV